MVDPVTTNVRLAQPLHSSHTDDWDQPLNANAGIIDTCFGSVTTKSVSNIAINLTDQESQANILRFTGTLTGNIAVTLGAIIKTWTIENLAVGNFFIRLQGNPGTGNFVGLPPGSCQVYWDGTNLSFVNLGKIGEYWDFAGSTFPVWLNACTIPPYLYCDGSAFSGVAYPLLAQILGGTTLPDARGRARFAFNAGTNRITSAGSGINGDVVLSAGGVQQQTIIQAHLPAVTFPNSLGVTRGGSLSLSGASNGVINNQGIGGGANVSGGGGAYNIGVLTVVDTQTFGISGGVTSGGAGAAFAIMNPAYIGGIVMIRAA